MKLFVLILLLLNVALFAVFNMGKPQQPAASVSHEQIQPEKIKLLSPEEVEAMPRKEPEAAQAFQAVQFGCYEWGSFSTANLVRARETLAGLQLTAVPIEKSAQEAARYWVYIPQSPTLPAAQARMCSCSIPSSARPRPTAR